MKCSVIDPMFTRNLRIKSIAAYLLGCLCSLSLQACAQPTDSSKNIRGVEATSEAPQIVTSGSPWALSGQEILLELSDARGEYPDGVYAWNAFNKGAAPTRPQLLIKGAHRPVWSPKHQRFAFEYKNNVCIADLRGGAVALYPALPLFLRGAGDAPVNWQPKEYTTTVVRSSAWGSKVFLGGLSEDIPLSQLSSAYDEAFDFTHTPIVPFRNLTPNNLSGGTSRWTELLTTNNAQISPDGNFLVAEVYPASPFDLQRQQSKVRVFDVITWGAGNNAAEAKQQEEI